MYCSTTDIDKVKHCMGHELEKNKISYLLIRYINMTKKPAQAYQFNIKYQICIEENKPLTAWLFQNPLEVLIFKSILPSVLS